MTPKEIRKKARQLQTADDALELVNFFLDDQRSQLLPDVSLGTYIDRLPDMFAARLALYIHALFATDEKRKKRSVRTR